MEWSLYRVWIVIAQGAEELARLFGKIREFDHFQLSGLSEQAKGPEWQRKGIGRRQMALFLDVSVHGLSNYTVGAIAYHQKIHTHAF